MRMFTEAGCSSRAVSSAEEVDLLGQDSVFSSDGIDIDGVERWSLTVTTDQDITVRVRKSAGTNAGLVLLSDLTTVVTSLSPLFVEFAGETNLRMRVTAQASAAEAEVNSDFRGVSP